MYKGLGCCYIKRKCWLVYMMQKNMDSTNQWIGLECPYVLYIIHESSLQLLFYLHGISLMIINLQHTGGQQLVSILGRSTVRRLKWICIRGIQQLNIVTELAADMLDYFQEHYHIRKPSSTPTPTTKSPYYANSPHYTSSSQSPSPYSNPSSSYRR